MIPIREYRFGKPTGRTFKTAEEAMAHIRELKQQRDERKQPREVQE